MKNLSVAVTDEFYCSVKSRTKELDVSVSDYLRDVISKDLETVSVKPIDESMSLLDRLSNVFGATITTVQPTKVDNSLTKWSIPKTFQKPYYNLFLRREMLYGEAVNNHVYCTHWNINDILYLKEAITYEPFVPGDAKLLANILNKSSQGVTRMVWNIQEGYLDQIIDEFKGKMSEIDFDSIEQHHSFSNLLTMNGEVTSMSIQTARELVDLMNVNGYSESTIWHTIKSYPNNDSLEVRVVCENYDNGQLLRLLHEEKGFVFENNPQKRREKAI